MASTYTTNLGLNLPARGDYLNTWDSPVNANFASIDQRIAGSTGIDVSAGSVTLSKAQMQYASFLVQGAIGANVVVTLAQNVGGLFSVLNATSGSGAVAFVVSGSSSSVVVPRGVRTLIFTDGTNVLFADQGVQDPPGSMIQYGGATTPAGYLLCYGQAVPRTTYAALFAAISTIWGAGDGSTTFNVPDMRGRVGAGADNMGGTASGRLDQIGGLGQVGGNEGMVLDVANLPAHAHPIQDKLHSHTLNDPTHAHSYVQSGINNTAGGQGGGTANTGGNNNSMTSAAATGVTIAGAYTGITTTDNAGTGAAFAIVQPTAMVNWIIKT